jgi:hypothetical protein
VQDPSVNTVDWWGWPNTPKILRRLCVAPGYVGCGIGALCYVHEGYLKDTRVLYCPLDTVRQYTEGSYSLMYAHTSGYDMMPANSIFVFSNNFVYSSYDFNPIQTSKNLPIVGTRVANCYSGGTYPFDQLTPSLAPLALDVLQSPLDNTQDAGGGESHPGDWNVLRFDGSVSKVHSPGLVARQANHAVMGSGSNYWTEYEYELQNYLIKQN